MMKSVILLTIFFLLTACSTNTIKIDFYASSMINPDKYQKALPVVIRIYQLKNGDKFMQSDFYLLWKKDQTILGDDLLNRQDIVLLPSENKTITLRKINTANCIGIMAIFRVPDQAYWRSLKSISSEMPLISTQIQANIIGNKIYITHE